MTATPLPPDPLSPEQLAKIEAAVKPLAAGTLARGLCWAATGVCNVLGIQAALSATTLALLEGVAVAAVGWAFAYVAFRISVWRAKVNVMTPPPVKAGTTQIEALIPK